MLSDRHPALIAHAAHTGLHRTQIAAKAERVVISDAHKGHRGMIALRVFDKVSGDMVLCVMVVSGDHFLGADAELARLTQGVDQCRNAQAKANHHHQPGDYIGGRTGQVKKVSDEHRRDGGIKGQRHRQLIADRRFFVFKDCIAALLVGGKIIGGGDLWHKGDLGWFVIKKAFQ
jgi:hypothetical protein